MATTGVHPVRFRIKLLLGVLGLAGLHWLLGPLFLSRSELFWSLIPVDILVLAAWLRVIPLPDLEGKSRYDRAGSLCLAASFPLLVYGGLTWICQTRFVGQECLMTMFFFICCLEPLLIYGQNLTTGLANRLSSRYSRLPAWSIKGAVKLVYYLLLFPCLLTIIAVHRPKLAPVAYEGIPVESVETIEFPSQLDHRIHLRGDFIHHPHPRGTVLCCHGVGANRGDISAIVALLHRSGYQVVTFDFRGHGDSSGHTITYGAQEQFDVLGAYDYCLSRKDVNPDRFYAWGGSMGAASLLLALPRMPQVKAAVVDSPFADLEGMVQHQFRFFPAAMHPPLLLVARGIGYLETGSDLHSIRPVDSVPHVHCPLTFIHGTGDFIVPPENTERLFEATSHKSQIHWESDAPHLGTVLQNETAYRELLNSTYANDGVDE